MDSLIHCLYVSNPTAIVWPSPQSPHQTSTPGAAFFNSPRLSAKRDTSHHFADESWECLSKFAYGYLLFWDVADGKARFLPLYCQVTK